MLGKFEWCMCLTFCFMGYRIWQPAWAAMGYRIWQPSWAAHLLVK